MLDPVSVLNQSGPSEPRKINEKAGVQLRARRPGLVIVSERVTLARWTRWGAVPAPATIRKAVPTCRSKISAQLRSRGRPGLLRLGVRWLPAAGDRLGSGAMPSLPRRVSGGSRRHRPTPPGRKGTFVEQRVAGTASAFSSWKMDGRPTPRPLQLKTASYRGPCSSGTMGTMNISNAPSAPCSKTAVPESVGGRSGRGTQSKRGPDVSDVPWLDKPSPRSRSAQPRNQDWR